MTPHEDHHPNHALARGEKRSLVLSFAFRTAGTPLLAALALVNTAIVVAHTGSLEFGLVSLVATIGLLLPFSDLGLGAIVTTAAARAMDNGREARAELREVIRRTSWLLCGVAGTGIVLACAMQALGMWGTLLGRALSSSQQTFVFIAVCLFFLTVPFGIGLRVITGVGLHHWVTALNMVASLGIVAGTLVVVAVGGDGLAYALPPICSPLLVNVASTAIAFWLLARRGLLGPPSEQVGGYRGLLSGAQWMFLISLGIPLGIHSGRLVVSHSTTAAELSEYALAAQFYSMAWGILTATAVALWPVFVRRRSAVGATFSVWVRSLWWFGGLGVLMGAGLALAAPFAGHIISAGRIEIPLDVALAFGCLLAVQAIHLPTGMMLTTPSELRWQAMCVLAMGVSALALSLWLVPEWGAYAAAGAAALCVLLCQVVPDLVHGPRLVRRREGAM